MISKHLPPGFLLFASLTLREGRLLGTIISRKIFHGPELETLASAASFFK